MAADGSIRIKALLNHSQFDRGVLSMGNSIKALTGTLTSLASAIGLAFGVAAIVNFGRESVKAAEELGNAWMGLQSIVEGQGRSFGKAKSFIEEYISDGLIPLTDAVTAYKNLAARGYNDEQLQKTMIALKDAAAFGRQSTYSLGEAVKTAAEGLKNENSILVDNAGVTKNVAKMWDEYAKSIGTTRDKLTQQQKIQAEVNGILEETKFQAGDAAKLVNTYSGQVAMLGFNFQQLKVQIGNAIMPIAQAVLPGINAIISALLKLAKVFAQVTSLLFGKANTGSSAQATTQDKIASSGLAAADATDKLGNSTADTGKKSKKAAKDMKGVLASFDELNILADQAASSVGDAAGGMDIDGSGIEIPELDTDGEIFDDVEISPKLMKEIDELRDALSRIWSVFKEAWDKNGLKVTTAALEALGSIYNLLKSIGTAFTEAFTGGSGSEWLDSVYKRLESILLTIRDIALALSTAFDIEGEDFFKSILDSSTEINRLWTSISETFRGVWSNGIGIDICRTILRIVTDINNVVGTLASKIREAWEKNGNGVAIWESILKIIQDVLDAIERMTSASLEWAQNLNLEPLVTAFRGLLEAIEPLVAVISNGLAWAYENVLLPFGKWFLEDLSPVAIELLTEVIRILTEVLETFQPLAIWLWESFLQPLSEWAGTVVIDALNELLELLRDLGDVLSGEISFGEFLSNLSPMQTALVSLAVAFGTANLAGMIGNFITSIGKIGEIIGNLLGTGIFAKLADVIYAVSTGILNLHDAMKLAFGSGSVIAGIASVIGGAMLAITNFLSMLENGFSWVNEALMLLGIAITAVGAIILGAPAVVAGVVAGIIAAVATIVVAVKEHWEEIKTAFTNALEKIKEIWGTVSDWFDENVIQPLVNFFTGAGERIGKIFEGCWILIQATWKLVSGWFNESVIQPTIDFFAPIVERIGNFFSKLWSNIKGIWEVVASWFNNTVITPTINFFRPIVEAVSGFFSNIWTNIKTVWQNAGKWFSDHVAKPIKDAFQSIKDFVRGIFNSLIGFVEGMINKIVSAINKFIGGFNNIVGKAAGFIGVDWSGVPKLPTVNLPRLANGAVIPPNQQFAAILGDQRSGKNIEAPATLIRDMVMEAIQAVGGVNSGQPIQVNIMLDRKVLARAMVNEVNSMTRAAGKPVLLI